MLCDRVAANFKVTFESATSWRCFRPVSSQDVGIVLCANSFATVREVVLTKWEVVFLTALEAL